MRSIFVAMAVMFSTSVFAATPVVTCENSEGASLFTIYENEGYGYYTNWSEANVAGIPNMSIERKSLKKNSEKKFYIKERHGSRFNPIRGFEEDLLKIKIDKTTGVGTYYNLEQYHKEGDWRLTRRVYRADLVNCVFN